METSCSIWNAARKTHWQTLPRPASNRRVALKDNCRRTLWRTPIPFTANFTTVTCNSFCGWLSSRKMRLTYSSCIFRQTTETRWKCQRSSVASKHWFRMAHQFRKSKISQKYRSSFSLRRCNLKPSLRYLTRSRLRNSLLGRLNWRKWPFLMISTRKYLPGKCASTLWKLRRNSRV